MPPLEFDKINWLAVLVSAAVTFLIGGAWYSALFGKLWIKCQGYTEEQVQQMQAQMKPAVFFGGMIACYLLVSLVLATLFAAAGVNTALGGAAWGFFLWLGLAAPIAFTAHLASNKKIGAFLIDVGYQLVFLLWTGIVLGAWN